MLLWFHLVIPGFPARIDDIRSRFSALFVEAFCLRMPRRKYFDVSNRWYAPTLRVRKSQNGGDLNKFFDDISLCY